MTVYFPDVASYQAGIDLAGALAVIIKITEGTGYVNPYYAAQAEEASHHGAFGCAYHFLHGGNAAAQADWCYSHAGQTPLCLDFEPVYAANKTASPRSEVSRGMRLPRGASAPTVTDAVTFIDRYRLRGGVLHVDYFPKWYWQQLGSPSMKPLTDRRMLLWSSDYGAAYTDADTGRGWQPYGGRKPAFWQYTSAMRFGGQPAVDFSAFRGSVYAGRQDDASVDACLAELKALAVTGDWPAPPAPGGWTYDPPVSAHAAGGRKSVGLSWMHAPVPAGRAAPWMTAFIYRGHGGCNRSNIVPGYPRPPVPGTYHLYGGLDPAVTGTRQYTAHLAAAAADGSHARSYAYASVQFEVSG